jgi:methionyl-tRNA formyltransferase
MKIIFAGTPEFAVPSLQALIDSTHEIVGVFTQPDRPAGRGRHLHASFVKQLAASHQLPVFQPSSLRSRESQELLNALQPDLMVVVAYGLLLPQAVLNIPRLGCINVHPSLLPRWRGAAPIQRSIEAGDRESGVTIMQLDAGMDTGPILLQEKIVLRGDETSAMMHDVFATMGAQLLLKTIAQLDYITPIKQNDAQATHAAKISKEEAVIDWHEDATTIVNKIRAFNPWPIAQTQWQETVVKIGAAAVVNDNVQETPGSITHLDKHTLHIAAKKGNVSILQVQVPGKKMMSIHEFIAGHQALLSTQKRQG